MDAIERLEGWKNKHKARACSIEVDDGYGATCWTVRLAGEKLKGDPTPDSPDRPTHLRNRTVVTGAECSFFGIELPPDVPRERRDQWLKETHPESVLFASPTSVWGDEDFDWPGLAATIHAALDRWHELENAGG